MLSAEMEDILNCLKIEDLEAYLDKRKGKAVLNAE